MSNENLNINQLLKLAFKAIQLRNLETAKDLLNFLDLEWQDEVRKYYETASKRGIISTPSFNQVNKKIYNKSVNKWKNYDKKFFQIKHSLKKWTKEFDY